VKSLVVDTLSAPVAHGHFVAHAAFPQWQIPTDVRPLSDEDFLFHRPSDPGQERNLWEERPDQRERMLRILRDLVVSEGAPSEQFSRLGL
jgi:hypothetical protein